MIGYVNIRGIRGSKYILEKVAVGYDILLFQETKLADGAEFKLTSFIFPESSICSGLAFAYRKDAKFTLEPEDATAYNNANRQVQLLKVLDPRLSHPVFLPTSTSDVKQHQLKRTGSFFKTCHSVFQTCSSWETSMPDIPVGISAVVSEMAWGYTVL